MLGAANAGVLISARVVGERRARVVIENRYNKAAITVPGGKMTLLVESGTTSTGNSADAWCYVQSGPTYLLANEKLFIAVRSESSADFLQVDASSFLRVGNVVA